MSKQSYKMHLYCEVGFKHSSVIYITLGFVKNIIGACLKLLFFSVQNCIYHHKTLLFKGFYAWYGSLLL